MFEIRFWSRTKQVTLQLELSSAGDYYFILILKVLKVQSKNNDESHVSSGTEPLQKKRNFLLQESLKMLKTTCHYTKGKKIENTIKAKLTKDKEFKISKINLEKKKSVRKMKKIRGKETDTKDKEFKIKNTTKPTKDKEFKIKNTSKINLEKKKIGEEDEENQRKKTENTKPTVYPEILISEKISWISLDTWGISIHASKSDLEPKKKISV
ncbi:unnamed protein product [Rhizophagus irregularis]|nr:unnamed protein product [Rhizophagus irregularis]